MNNIRPHIIARIIASLLACCVLLNIVLPLTEFSEARKVVALIEHYREHQHERPTGVWEFLVMHYTPDSQHLTQHLSQHFSQHLAEHSHTCSDDASSPLAAPRDQHPVAHPSHRHCHHSLPLHSLSSGAGVLAIVHCVEHALLVPPITRICLLPSLPCQLSFFPSSIFQPPKAV
jgi:hypothetical protein